MNSPLSRGLPVFLLLGLASLADAAPTPTPSPAPSVAPATAVRWKPEADMDNQLYPALIIATANRRPGTEDQAASPDLLGDHYGLLGISARSTVAGTRVKVTIRENEVLNTSTWSGSLPKGEHTYYIAPPIAYKFDALRHIRQQRPLSVQFDVEINNQPAGTQSETITLRSVNDCPYSAKNSETTLEDVKEDRDEKKRPQHDPGMRGSSYSALGWMFAAYVNEDHPIIDVMLNEALHTGLITSVDGYQDRKPEEVLRQAFAVWKVLQDRGIRYSDVSTTPGAGDKVTSQYVRFVDESLRNQQANCVDGSVLFASVLRKMGLAPFLVVVPHHMYVGVALSPKDDDDTVACIETTLLGVGEQDNSLKTPPALAALERSLSNSTRSKAEWRTFKIAVSYATAQYLHDKSKFEDDSNSDYQVIDVATARRDGIMPIPFDRTDTPPTLPGGPTATDTPAPTDKPLPTPFVAPSPTETPEPRNTPMFKPKPTPTPGGSPARPSPSPMPSDATPTPEVSSPTPRPGGGSAWEAANATPGASTPTPVKPKPRQTPAPTPTPTPRHTPGKDDYDGFFGDKRG